jgi:hypothetical protein
LTTSSTTVITRQHHFIVQMPAYQSLALSNHHFRPDAYLQPTPTMNSRERNRPSIGSVAAGRSFALALMAALLSWQVSRKHAQMCLCSMGVVFGLQSLAAFFGPLCSPKNNSDIPAPKGDDEHEDDAAV